MSTEVFVKQACSSLLLRLLTILLLALFLAPLVCLCHVVTADYHVLGRGNYSTFFLTSGAGAGSVTASRYIPSIPSSTVTAGPAHLLLPRTWAPSSSNRLSAVEISSPGRSSWSAVPETNAQLNHICVVLAAMSGSSWSTYTSSSSSLCFLTSTSEGVSHDSAFSSGHTTSLLTCNMFWIPDEPPM